MNLPHKNSKLLLIKVLIIVIIIIIIIIIKMMMMIIIIIILIIKITKIKCKSIYRMPATTSTGLLVTLHND